MYLRNGFRSFCGLMGLVFVLTSCSSAPFPEIVDESDYTTADSSESNFDVSPRKRTLEEGASLGADTENVAYEGQQNAAPVKKPSTSKKSVQQETKAVVLQDPDEEIETFGELTDEKFKEELAINETISESAEPSVTYLVGTIYFNNGSSAVDNSYNTQIREIVKQAKSKKAVLNVYGYASSRTRNTDIVSHKMANFKVSSARAENVADALRRAGMSATKIKTEALSDANPAYFEVMPEGERLNRRAEIYISY